jgi:hypothetical protein
MRQNNSSVAAFMMVAAEIAAGDKNMCFKTFIAQ